MMKISFLKGIAAALKTSRDIEKKNWRGDTGPVIEKGNSW